MHVITKSSACFPGWELNALSTSVFSTKLWLGKTRVHRSLCVGVRAVGPPSHTHIWTSVSTMVQSQGQAVGCPITPTSHLNVCLFHQCRGLVVGFGAAYPTTWVGGAMGQSITGRKLCSVCRGEGRPFRWVSWMMFQSNEDRNQ